VEGETARCLPEHYDSRSLYRPGIASCFTLLNAESTPVQQVEDKLEHALGVDTACIAFVGNHLTT